MFVKCILCKDIIFGVIFACFFTINSNYSYVKRFFQNQKRHRIVQINRF